MNEQLQKKVDFAIRLLRNAEKMADKVGQPLEVQYSGGKDSEVILELAKMAGVKYRAIYKNTTIDPPGTIKHARSKGVEVMAPTMTFREVLEKHGIVSRFRRACCQHLKEYKILDYAVLGIRRCESKKRTERYKEPELCRVYNKKEKTRQYLPILEWTDQDVADFIAERGIQCHPLYYDEQGNFHPERRLGCMGCPMASNKKRVEEFKQYPNMVKFWCNGGQKFLDTHPDSKIHGYFNNAYEWFCMSLFCKNLREFREKFGANMFGGRTDCKQFLSDYFGITL
jgi:phosphoadenosine phosphosulfate reductase